MPSVCFQCVEALVITIEGLFLRYGIVNFGDLRPCERQKYQSNSFEIELTHVIFGGG